MTFIVWVLQGVDRQSHMEFIYLLMYFFNLLYTGFRFHDRLPRQFWYLDECVICVKMFSLDTHKHICRFSIL